AAVEKDESGLWIEAGAGSYQCRRVAAMSANILIGLIDGPEQGVDHFWMVFRDRAGRLVEADVVRQTFAISQHMGNRARFRRRPVRVPDRPRIDTVPLERRTRVSGSQVNGLDVSQTQTRFLQRPQKQVVRARTALKGNALAPQGGQGSDA